MLYLSRFITQNKAEYYKQLQTVRETGTWESWLLYILDGIIDTAKNTDELVVTRITATKYLEQLVEHGFLQKQRIGRANYYINQPLCALLMARG